MDTQLWDKILKFNLDLPYSDYGFSIRLSSENTWSIDFTEKAILEYKKFMFLAATNDFMVSPSEIVDIVWHQHLIFTKSYEDFCQILGNKIGHYPSTKKRSEVQMFKNAVQNTKAKYFEVFGEQPVDFWEDKNMFDNFNLPKSNYKFQSIILILVIFLIISIISGHYLLNNVLSQIENPNFLIGFIFLSVCCYFGLKIFNTYVFKNWINQLDPNSFIYNLRPEEILYFQNNNINNSITFVLDNKIRNSLVTVSDDLFFKTDSIHYFDNDDFIICETIREKENIGYTELLLKLESKPRFQNIIKLAEEIKKYMLNSKFLQYVFLLNSIIIILIFTIGVSRLIRGAIFGKPIVLILITLVIFIIVFTNFLTNIFKYFNREGLTQLYYNELVPILRKEKTELDWNYFLFGSTALYSPLMHFENRINSNSNSNSNNSGSGDTGGSSCGSSDGGSSCSSCGGCGGGD